MGKSVIVGTLAKSLSLDSESPSNASLVTEGSGERLQTNEPNSLGKESQKPLEGSMESSLPSGMRTSVQSLFTSVPCGNLKQSFGEEASTTLTLGYTQPGQETKLKASVVVRVFDGGVLEFTVTGNLSRKTVNESVVRGILRCLRVHREDTLRKSLKES